MTHKNSNTESLYRGVVYAFAIIHMVRTHARTHKRMQAHTHAFIHIRAHTHPYNYVHTRVYTRSQVLA